MIKTIEHLNKHFWGHSGAMHTDNFHSRKDLYAMDRDQYSKRWNILKYRREQSCYDHLRAFLNSFDYMNDW